MSVSTLAEQLAIYEVYDSRCLYYIYPGDEVGFILFTRRKKIKSGLAK